MAQNSSGRGFAALPSQEQRRIAAMGGRASHESGHGHEWTREEAQEYGRRGGLASHHHERAAFHHETAAHHHQRAASHHATGNRTRANLHAQSAYEHERRAGDHADLAARHSRAQDDDSQDTRDSSFERDRDSQGRFQSSNEERQGGFRETGSDYRAETSDRANNDDDTRRTGRNNSRNDDDYDVEPRRAGSNSNFDRRDDQDSGIVNGRSESNGTARENS